MSSKQKLAAALKEDSSTSDPQTVVHNSDLAEYLDFSTISKTFEEITKGIRLIDPFFEKEIIVYLPIGAKPWDDDVELNRIMSIIQNKPFNVLLYWTSLKNLIGKELEKRKAFFEFKESIEKNAKTYARNMKMLLFMLMLLYTRGSVPSVAISDQNNSLPRLLINHLDMREGSIEQDFAKMFSGVDVRKVNLAPLLDIKLTNLPAELKNRIKLGFAGSRILKLFLMSKPYVEERDAGTRTKVMIIYDTMIEIASSGTAYKNAHPLTQIVQNAIPGFYVKMICVIAANVGETDWPFFLTHARKIPSFEKDRKLNDLLFKNGQVEISSDGASEGYDDINVTSLKRNYGSLIEF